MRCRLREVSKDDSEEKKHTSRITRSERKKQHDQATRSSEAPIGNKRKRTKEKG
jgi:hypothetical protein